MAWAKRHYVPNQIWHITPRCHKWVRASLEKIGAKRDSRWTESIAVGSSQFTDPTLFIANHTYGYISFSKNMKHQKKPSCHIGQLGFFKMMSVALVLSYR